MQKNLNQNHETQSMLGMDKIVVIIGVVWFFMGLIFIKYDIASKLAETLNFAITPFDTVIGIFRYITNH